MDHHHQSSLAAERPCVIADGHLNEHMIFREFG